MATVLIPLANGFEDIEAVTIIDVLRRGGVEVVTASIHETPDVRSAHGIPMKADALFSSVSDGDFDAITGKRDNSDLPPDVRERVEPKAKPEDVVLDEENSFAFASGELDSTYIENLDSFAVDEEEAEEVTSLIDSALLQQQIEELETELQNVRDINELERSKNRKGDVILRKIKIPNCRYLNDVYYVRDKFEFRYEYDFFLHYFDHRYFHKKKFYDMNDTTRVVAKYVMQLVGKSKYRHTDFNKVADSIAGFMPDYPVVEYLDSVITDLNLEYLATGEIKIKYKNRRQGKILSKILPTKINPEGGGSLGNIKFYTSNKRRVIEELDASQYDSLLIQPDSLQMQEKHLADSLNEILSKKLEQDSLQRVQDSLSLLTDAFAMDGSEKDSLHQVLDDMLFGTPASDSTAVADSTMNAEGEEMADSTAAPQKVAPLAATDPISLNDIQKYIKLLEAQRNEKKSPEQKNNSIMQGMSMPSIPPTSVTPVMSIGNPKKEEPTNTVAVPNTNEEAPKVETPSDQMTGTSEETQEAQPEESRRSRRKKAKAAKEAETEAAVEQSEEPVATEKPEEPKVEVPKTENVESSSQEETVDSSAEEEESGKKKRSRSRRKKSKDNEDGESGENSEDDWQP